MTGHANRREEAELKRRLQDIESGEASESEQLETALILVEPFHQEDRALQILQELIDRNPEATQARLWCAYLLAHHCMDPDSLELAKSHLERLLDTTEQMRAAALQLLAYVEHELGDAYPVHYLEKSVELRPSWVINRWLWAAALLKRGSLLEASEQLLQALKNFTGEEVIGSNAQQEFEQCFVGKSSIGLKREIERALLRLDGQNHPDGHDGC